MAKLQWGPISFVKEHLAYHWTDFREIWYLNIFREADNKIRILLQRDKINEYFTWRTVNIFGNLMFFRPWNIV